VSRAEEMAECEVFSVYAGIAGDHIKSFNTHGTTPITRDNYEITEDDIQKAVESAKAVSLPMDRVVLDYLPYEYRVDGHSGVSDPVGMSGAKLEVGVHIVTGAVTVVQNIEKCIERAGFEVEKIVLEPLASSMATLSDEELEMGVVLIDIGGGTTDTAIFLDRKIHYSHVLPLGGNNVTNDMAIGLRIPFNKAEEIKRKYGMAFSANVEVKKQFVVPGVIGRASRNMALRDLASIIEVRMEEIFLFVKKNIEKSGYQQKIGSGIVLTGGCSMLENIDALAEKVFNVPVRIGKPRGVTGLVDVLQSPIYATGTGLIHYGFLARSEGVDKKAIRKKKILHGVLSRMKNLYKGGAE
ncbi:MAG: cell division protein FtsA, partial [Candidatus Aureabacteria bacterium]|nr:cell division protein FtsA [Candidatus Auribacterota bacterium]